MWFEDTWSRALAPSSTLKYTQVHSSSMCPFLAPLIPYAPPPLPYALPLRVTFPPNTTGNESVRQVVTRLPVSIPQLRIILLWYLPPWDERLEEDICAFIHTLPFLKTAYPSVIQYFRIRSRTVTTLAIYPHHCWDLSPPRPSINTAHPPPTSSIRSPPSSTVVFHHRLLS